MFLFFCGVFLFFCFWRWLAFLGRCGWSRRQGYILECLVLLWDVYSCGHGDSSAALGCPYEIRKELISSFGAKIKEFSEAFQKTFAVMGSSGKHRSF